MSFESKRFIGSKEAHEFGARYRRAMAKYPFLLFGLPFMAIIVGASFVITPATAIRYEKHDRKVRQMDQKEEKEVFVNKRKFDIREEYFVGSSNASRVFVLFAVKLWSLTQHTRE